MKAAEPQGRKKGDHTSMRLNSRVHRFHSRLILPISVAILFALSMPVSSMARMTEVDEEELSQISAQAGISYVIGNSLYRITTTSYRFSDTDSTPYNWIELNNFTIDDGSGTGYFSMDTPEDEADFNTIDVGTDASGLTSVFMNLSLNVEPRTYTIGDFVFCGQEIGSLVLENFQTAPSNKMIFSGRNDGCGLNFEYQTEIMIDSFQYIFNETTPASLALTNIHLAESASGDPTDASTWTFTGKFKLGDMANSNPATIDIGTVDNGDGTTDTSVFYNIPMTGSLRVESVNFGGTDLGPCAIDGITVHHLGIQIPGN